MSDVRQFEVNVGTPRGFGKVIEAIAKEAGVSRRTLERELAKLPKPPPEPPEECWGVVRLGKKERLRRAFFKTRAEAEAELIASQQVEPRRRFEVVRVTIHFEG